MPIVSVVIPAHNAMPYLITALNSVLQQTFGDFEVLVVDDGSQDDTGDWITTVNDRRVLLISQANQGASGARNTGISHAKGQYIAFLDADDIWNPVKLEKQVDYLNNHQDVGLVSTKAVLVDAEARFVREIEQPYAANIAIETLLESNCILCGSTPLVRRSCFNTVGVFDLELRTFEDWDMWIRIAYHYPIAVIMEPLVSYRQHSASLSKNTFYMVESLEKLMNKVKKELLPAHVRTFKESYVDYRLKMAWKMLAIGNYKQSMYLLLTSFLSHPDLLLSRSCLRLLSLILIKSTRLQILRGNPRGY